MDRRKFLRGILVPLVTSMSLTSPCTAYAAKNADADDLMQLARNYVSSATGIDHLSVSFSESYLEGETIDRSKAEVTAFYKDGSQKDVTNQAKLDVPKEASADKKEDVVTASYMAYRAETEINVVPIEGVDFSYVGSEDTKEGDTLDASNFTSQVRYADGQTKECTDPVNAKSMTLKTGDNKVTLSQTVNGKRYTDTLTIKARELIAEEEADKAMREEYDSALYKYRSDTVYLTGNKYDAPRHGGTYLLTHVVVKDPKQLKAGLSYDDYGGKREKATENAARNNWVVGTNGSYFHYSTGTPACCGVIIKNGQIMEGTNAAQMTEGDEVCLMKDGSLWSPKPGVTAQDLLDMGVTDTFGAGEPVLIQDGVKTEGLSDGTSVNCYNLYPRTAWGMVKPGEYYILTAGEGTYKNGVTVQEMQDIFAEKGCVYARSLDGGGSATLVVDGKLMNDPAVKSEERPVTDFLYITD